MRVAAQKCFIETVLYGTQNEISSFCLLHGYQDSRGQRIVLSLYPPTIMITLRRIARAYVRVTFVSPVVILYNLSQSYCAQFFRIGGYCRRSTCCSRSERERKQGRSFRRYTVHRRIIFTDALFIGSCGSCPYFG